MNGGRGMTSGKDVPDRWRTAIIDMEPGRIHLRARPVRDLIGTTGFPQGVWPTVSVWDALPVSAIYDAGEPSDMNFMLSTSVASPDFAASFTSGIVDLTPHGVLYLHGSFGTNSTIDTAGRKAILCSILVDVPYGALVHEEHGGLGEDSVDVSNARFRNMSFSIRNCFGQVVDLRGGDVTIELCFGPTK